MADPLALLGDAFANFGANYAQRHFQNEREDKLRRQQLDDRAQARQFQLDDRQHAETRDDTIYSQRKYDSIKAQLIKDGVLDPKNDSLEAMAAALRSRGPNYEQSVVELANMKAHAREIIDRSKGDPAGLGRIATMDVSQIDDARALYSRALSSMGFKLSSDEDRIRTNQEAGGEALSNANAAMVAANQRIAQLNNEYERVTGGQLTDEEVAKIKQQARSAPELASLEKTDLLKPSNKALVEAAITKAEQNFRAMRAFQIQGEAKNASTQQRNAAVQLEAITAAARSGLPIKFNSAAVTGDAAAATAEAPKTATAQDWASFVASLRGDRKAAPVSAMDTAASATAALSNPVNDPIISAENQRRAGANWQHGLADPYNAALDEVDAAKREIEAIKNGGTNMPGVAPFVPGAFAPMPVYSDATKAPLLSGAYTKLANAQAKAEAARRAMLGLGDGR